MFSIHRNHLSYQGVDYVTFGRGDKVLVIITGLSLQGLSDMSDLAIYSLFYRYAKEYKVYIFDRKDHIEEGISIENIADDLYHSLQELHIANASIIGMSQGGMIAQLFAIKYPQKLTSLVLALTFSRNNDISRDTIVGWIEMAKNGEMAKLNKDSMCKTFSSPLLKKLYVINKLFLKTVSVEKQERFVRLAKSILEFDCHKLLDKSPVRLLSWELKKIWFWEWMVQGNLQIAFQMLPIMNLANRVTQPLLKVSNLIKLY